MPQALANPVVALNDATIGVTPWVDVNNVLGSNDLIATTSPANGQASQGLRGRTFFGDTVNPAATPTGITARVERRATASNRGKDNSLRLLVAGLVVGQEKALAASWSNSFTWAEYGGPTDLWGLPSLAPATELGLDSFGLRLSVLRTASQAVSFEVRRMEIIVHWAPYPPEGS